MISWATKTHRPGCASLAPSSSGATARPWKIGFKSPTEITISGMGHAGRFSGKAAKEWISILTLSGPKWAAKETAANAKLILDAVNGFNPALPDQQTCHDGWKTALGAYKGLEKQIAKLSATITLSREISDGFKAKSEQLLDVLRDLQPFFDWMQESRQSNKGSDLYRAVEKAREILSGKASK